MTISFSSHIGVMDITPYNAPEVNGTGEELSILMRSPWLHTKKILPCWGFFSQPFTMKPDYITKPRTPYSTNEIAAMIST